MKKYFVIFSTLLLLVGCDRLTKIQAIDSLKGNNPISYFGGFFKFIYVENSGAMLGLGGTLPGDLRFYIFTVAVGIILFGGLIYIAIKPMSKINLILGLLIVGGGFGNLYDRAFNDGLVVDFMLIGIGPLRTGIFNVADIAITVGAIGLIIFTSKWGKKLTNIFQQTAKSSGC
ncbi:MAG: signal peptidase II [Desulfobacteraceae bacterium]|jgi:signal peptidase II|nr:signal peptidase II [Desulfobacteraceae bacterium]